MGEDWYPWPSDAPVPPAPDAPVLPAAPVPHSERDLRSLALALSLVVLVLGPLAALIGSGLAAGDPTVLVLVLLASLVGGGALAARPLLGARSSRALRRGLLDGRRDVVLDAWAAYELSLLEVFSRPALADVSVPETARFLSALDAVSYAAALPGSSALDGYEAAVLELESAWRLADSHATRVGLGFLPDAEASRVRQAVHALQLALSTPLPEERAQAYATAMRLVDGIVVGSVLDRAVLELAPSLRLALPAPSPS